MLPYECGGYFHRICAFVGYYKVFPPVSPHDTRITFVSAYVISNRLPNGLEGLGGSCKVNTGKIRVTEDHFAGFYSPTYTRVDQFYQAILF